MRVVIVDDEAPARRRLIRMLATIDGVEVVGEASDGVEALELIETLNPDLLLLDIRMPRLDGMAVAACPHLPPIVFTTAHMDHALDAFEVDAVDYLLKPIEPERLRRAIERARSRELRFTPRALVGLLEQAEKRTPSLPRIAARAGDTVRVLDPRELTRLYASDKYTLTRHQGEELILDESLATLEQELREHHFLRVHRRELINLEHVRAVHGGEGQSCVELSDGQRAVVSRRMLAELKRRLGLA